MLRPLFGGAILTLLSAENLSFSYGTREIFAGLNFAVGEGDRVANRFFRIDHSRLLEIEEREIFYDSLMAAGGPRGQ